MALGVSLLRFAKGGHAGDLTVALWFHAGGMPWARTLGRSLLSIVIVGLGAALGREGALKQTGAVIGWRWAHWAKLSSEQRRLLTACGAGAGMAAAYNVPLGGALFALEVLLGSISLPYAAPAIVCSVLATVTSWLLLPMQPAYATPHFQLSLNQVGWAVLVGPLIGGRRHPVRPADRLGRPAPAQGRRRRGRLRQSWCSWRWVWRRSAFPNCSATARTSCR